MFFLFCGLIDAAFVVVVAYESGIMTAGTLAADKGREFAVTTAMELLTIILIPVALRLFKMRRVSDELDLLKEAALLKWGTLRLLMLGCPLVVNTLLYYLFMQTAFGYLAIITLICMPFVYPSKNRCYYEVKSVETDEADGNNR